MKHNILVFRELFSLNNFLGNNREEGTPVPIPNTEVKLFIADDSVCENRTLPRIFFCYFLIYFLLKSKIKKVKKCVDFLFEK